MTRYSIGHRVVWACKGHAKSAMMRIWEWLPLATDVAALLLQNHLPFFCRLNSPSPAAVNQNLPPFSPTSPASTSCRRSTSVAPQRLSKIARHQIRIGVDSCLATSFDRIDPGLCQGVQTELLASFPMSWAGAAKQRSTGLCSSEGLLGPLRDQAGLASAVASRFLASSAAAFTAASSSAFFLASSLAFLAACSANRRSSPYWLSPLPASSSGRPTRMKTLLPLQRRK